MFRYYWADNSSRLKRIVFLQILVDACTGLTYIKVLRNKSEAGAAKIRSMSKIQQLCDRKAKRLYTGGAKEQDTRALREFLKLDGSTSTKTAPNTFQSNAFAERYFRQFMAATRSAMAEAPHMPKILWSYAALDAADKGNYLSTAKTSTLKASPLHKFTSCAHKRR